MFTAAKNLLLAESEAIKIFSEHLNSNFQKAVEILLNHRGKTIVCGMGKSGHIARKIAATFTSIGQSSVFLHPSEGAHGDLGVYSAGDPTILLSKSGTTDEILCLIPTLKKFKSKIISIVGNANSPIAKASDVVIDISFAKEADPLQMVPTTSSIVSLAVGDALAAELMFKRSFTKQDFAAFHPAGQLGRNLLLKVSDIMSPISSCAVVSSASSIREIVIAMTEFPLGAAIVTDNNGEINGIITDGDIRRALKNNLDFSRTFAENIMTKNPKSVIPNDSIGDAIKIMEEGQSQISVLPVVEVSANNKNIAIGLIRLHDTYKH